MPSFSRMLARCRSTVLTEITSSAAISLEVCPSAMSLTTSSSRGVSTSNSPPSRSVLLTKSRTSAVTAEGYRKDSPRMAARHASTMSRSAPDFSTYPEAPARSASNRNCSLSYIDSITICRQRVSWRGGGRDHQTDLPRQGLLDRLSAVRRLSDDLKVRLTVQQQRQPTPHHSMVVGDQDP